MPRYSITGKGRETGRKRTRIYDARTADQAKALAEAEGTIVESLTQLPPEPPTDRQLAYAKDLGIQVPADADKWEVSDLISRRVDDDLPPDDEDFRLARHYDINFTRYTGKRDIALRIFHTLDQPGREADLIAWFAYHVAIHLNGRSKSPVSIAHDSSKIQQLATELARDPSVVKSIRRYGAQDFKEFGKQVEEDEFGEWERSGTTTRTIAFRRVVEKLGEYGIISRAQRTPPQARVRKSITQPERNHSKTVSGKGCFPMVIGIGIVILMAIGTTAATWGR